MICLFSGYVISAQCFFAVQRLERENAIPSLGRSTNFVCLARIPNPGTFGLRVRRRMILVTGDLWRGPGLGLTPKQLQGG